ncbi:DUF308 domain-containing protein [Bacillus tuaregi]|uniref:DUF308 domain-containing protein n=1 Tax=Bacillus tuaregi TaxID=1816695 RepID=UPI0008F90CB5|nr:DUF308 domain-containing protein [Bacillus tuaregi]
MADLDPNNVGNQELQKEQNDGQLYGVDNFGEQNYREETAAEIAAPTSMRLNERTGDKNEARAEGGTGIGLAAIALSILSLFVFPVLFGAAGIVLGFIARAKGARTGSWAITIGAISLILGMFILPFF